MKNHADLQHQIPAYAAGRLDAEARREIEGHLAICANCRGLVSFCEAVANQIRPPDRPDANEHPAPLTLRLLADSGATVPREVASHVELCPTCRLEVEAWKRWRPENVLTGRRLRARWVPWLTLRPLAVGVLLGALIVVATFWGGDLLRTSSWSGLTDPLMLDEPSRSSGSPRSVRLESGQPYIPLLVRVPLPPGSDGARFGLSVLRADGDRKVTMEREMSAEQIRQLQADDWVLCFMLRAEDHPPGRYLLRVVAETGTRAEPMLEIPFDVVP